MYELYMGIWIVCGCIYCIEFNGLKIIFKETDKYAPMTFWTEVFISD